ncbi:T9SS type A sorting domain-containing protein [Aquimarina sp. ERC-38]|uniref:T9SS type A sorting domain-containing protein n=1 Tax=Aquimarina sp. ERC-38 TaxID=2949996 RepID=UPI002247F8E9|nr:T9SS type A sorting domain-containing protein [Aquimarina sp. ERC-38]UZO81477.1 T9SS type A sorting domain-containing protein [Aquimarina sp. ERC-38]
MKNLLITTVFLLSFCVTAIAQCVRSGSFEGGPRENIYPISGTGKIEFSVGETAQVIFDSDFRTVQGITLLTFLSTDGKYDQGVDLEVSNNQPLESDNGNPNMGNAITGMKSFNIPDGVSINDYQYIILQCVSANVTWGTVALGNPAGSECNTILATPKNELENISVYPNPASAVLNIQNPLFSTSEIRIFDTLGNVVLQQEAQSEAVQIDTNSLSGGLYLVQVQSGVKSTTLPVVIK